VTRLVIKILKYFLSDVSHDKTMDELVQVTKNWISRTIERDGHGGVFEPAIAPRIAPNAVWILSRR